jgi:hypothetical protein
MSFLSLHLVGEMRDSVDLECALVDVGNLYLTLIALFEHKETHTCNCRCAEATQR